MMGLPASGFSPICVSPAVGKGEGMYLGTWLESLLVFLMRMRVPIIQSLWQPMVWGFPFSSPLLCRISDKGTYVGRETT